MNKYEKRNIIVVVVWIIVLTIMSLFVTQIIRCQCLKHISDGGFYRKDDATKLYFQYDDSIVVYKRKPSLWSNCIRCDKEYIVRRGRQTREVIWRRDGKVNP